MNLVDWLSREPLGFAAALLPLGLIAGSFLNVVIHRLPRMMERSWETQARALLQLEAAPPAPPYNLIRPASACPHCNTPIRAWQNIPLLSYLLLRGRCRHCGASISARYPVVELLAALLACVAAYRFGFGWHAAGAVILTWALLALSVIDLETFLLPDSIVLPLLWAGLLFNLSNGYTTLESAVLGAVTGYLLLWAVYHSFRALTGKEGMGHGDFKLLAMLGAWLGTGQLPAIILLSSLIGAATGICLIAAARHRPGMPLPFGPFLAGAGWVALLWGEELTRVYLSTFQGGG